MKRIILVIISLLVLFVFPHKILGQTGDYYENSYVFREFNSFIEVEKDTSLTITETIKVNFPYPKHGIYRIIPVSYTASGRTIKTGLEVLAITDLNGKRVDYEKSKLGQSVQLKIGDADTTLTGEQTYIIKYRLTRVIQRFDSHDEVYWNVTGHEWDADILSSSVNILSPSAGIIKFECFAGEFGSISRECTTEFSGKHAFSASSIILGTDRDFTVVVGLSKENSLIFPTKTQELMYIVTDNWGYIFAIVPLFLMLYFWNKKGRDLRYISENIYFEPDDKAQRTVKLFERPHIPFVYHPIAKLTPGEVGTIVDERVHISDVVSEILELARLGFITIRKIETKKLFGTGTEYAFIKSKIFDDEEQRNKLKDFQEYLLNELFRSTIIHKSVENAERLFKGNEEKLAEVRKLLIDKDYVLLSGVKNHFYEGLPVFKNKLYQRMESEKIFDGDPEKTRGKWIGIYILMDVLSGIFVFNFANLTANFVPLVALSILSIPGIFLALAMPRRTSKGYSFYRQINGLKWYLAKGAWRHKVAENNLFIEEILPLAVSLGVVGNLSKDMAELGIRPPSYFEGTSTGTFYRDLTSFNTASSSSLLSAPPGKASGGSSWSGGSGFSGGSSGGGFGGGGGGSW